MAILANRIRQKNYLIEFVKFLLFYIQRLSIISFILISCYLLYFSPPKPLTNSLLDFTGKTASVISLIYNESVKAIYWFQNRMFYLRDLESENLKLKLELNNIKHRQSVLNDLQKENIELKNLLNVANSTTNNFVATEIIGINISPFASYAIIKAGSNAKIKINDLVKGKRGLIGRITNVSNNYSTVMLVDDNNSRIPVLLGQHKTKGILAKQGDDLKVIYLPENHQIQIGDIIYSSGDGDIYPRGIPVAVVDRIEGTSVIAKILEDLDKLEFVLVTTKID